MRLFFLKRMNTVLTLDDLRYKIDGLSELDVDKVLATLLTQLQHGGFIDLNDYIIREIKDDSNSKEEP